MLYNKSNYKFKKINDKKNGSCQSPGFLSFGSVIRYT